MFATFFVSSTRAPPACALSGVLSLSISIHRFSRAHDLSLIFLAVALLNQSKAIRDRSWKDEIPWIRNLYLKLRPAVDMAMEAILSWCWLRTPRWPPIETSEMAQHDAYLDSVQPTLTEMTCLHYSPSQRHWIPDIKEAEILGEGSVSYRVSQFLSWWVVSYPQSLKWGKWRGRCHDVCKYKSLKHMQSKAEYIRSTPPFVSLMPFSPQEVKWAASGDSEADRLHWHLWWFFSPKLS